MTATSRYMRIPIGFLGSRSCLFVRMGFGILEERQATFRIIELNNLDVGVGNFMIWDFRNAVQNPNMQ